LLKRIVGSYVSIGTYLYEGGYLASPIVEAEYDFYPSGREVELLTNELLQGKFTFNKKLKRG